MTEQLTKLFKKNADKTKAIPMEAYMKNNFLFFWIPSPLRKQIEKERFKTLTIENWKQLKDTAIELWSLDQREYQYAAITLLEKYKKLRIPDSIKYFEKMITQKSRWDTVDSIDTNLVWKYFLLFPNEKEKYILKRAQSNNIWLQRTAIQFQLMYKDKTDTALIENIFSHTKDSNEFFVQKAMWWILREYSKTNQKRVSDYINKNNLPKLTIREWSKYI